MLLRPVDNAIVMQQLRYADEVRSIAEIPLGDAKVKNDELELALQIINQGVSDVFRPQQYEDEVRRRVLRLVEKKVEGKEITAAPAEEPKAQVIDLMEALKASLGTKSEGPPTGPASRRQDGSQTDDDQDYEEKSPLLLKVPHPSSRAER